MEGEQLLLQQLDTSRQHRDRPNSDWSYVSMVLFFKKCIKKKQMKLKVNRFNMDTMKPHRIIIIVGKRGTGKSVMQRDIMKHIADKVEFGIAMSPTEETTSMFREHMPDSFIFNSFAGEKLDEMILVQREAMRKQRSRALFVLMDDCMYDKKVLKGAGMRDLFMNGRHLHICFCNAMQYVMDMGPDLRTQVDYVFAMRENIIANKAKLWKYFFGMFEKYEDFSKVMDTCTENHSALVMDNTTGSNNIEDCIFWYKAPIDQPPFKMGKSIFWKLSERYTKTQEQQDEHERELSELALMEMNVPAKRRISCVQCTDASVNPELLHL